ncbi:MAG: CehA/McbA family metallohydrolase [Pirellulales bacterium]
MREIQKYANRTALRGSVKFVSVIFWLAATAAAAELDELTIVTKVEHQPLVAATGRLLEALDYVGAPLPADDNQAVRAALKNTKAAESIEAIQRVLDRYCVAGVHINPESRVKVAEGAAAKQLVQQGWRSFLVKVHNEAGINPVLKAESPNALPLYMRGRGSRQRPQTSDKLVPPSELAQRFLDIAMFDRQPLKPQLSGLALEYRIIQLYSRDVGRREAKLAFNVGQGTQDIGFRNNVPILFDCVPAVDVVLDIKDFDGKPTTAGFVIRDSLGRIYPNPARRLAPDFFFHNQIYRSNEESVLLPPGEFTAIVSRGPEYLVQTQKFTVKAGIVSQRLSFQLRRWTHPAARGWFSGDHHIHAAGCAHYDSPTEGVAPVDMMRHILGEDLNVGCVLSWGPCWYTQKQYFEGKTSALSRGQYLMRYDVEVSGFPSSHAGHLCLLRLTEDDYPGTKILEQWPSWTLPVLAWGKRQGGVVGYSHSGWGLQLPDHMPDGSRKFPKGSWGGANAGWKGTEPKTLPDYAMPRFDGIGANEYIVTVAHDVCDFISTVDTPSIWELNIWYHTLNCGFRTRISGETDFPCIYGDKVGLGRIYVKLPTEQKLTFDNWVGGVKDGRSYCGDGLSHIFDFKINDVAVGEPGSGGEISQLDLAKPGKVKASFDVAALLAAKPSPQTEAIRSRRLDQKPYWHIERCRLGDTRQVPVEIIVNGYPTTKRNIVADGSTQSLEFDIELKQSSWIAVRILPSVHTNPVFVKVGGQPIRASRRSAEWCRKAVDVCWKSKHPRIGADEGHKADREAAATAYEFARKAYDRISAESIDDRGN